jgi:hypothetical protein
MGRGRVTYCDFVKLSGVASDQAAHWTEMRNAQDIRMSIVPDHFYLLEYSWINSPNEKQGLMFNRHSPQLQFRLVCD